MVTPDNTDPTSDNPLCSTTAIVWLIGLPLFTAGGQMQLWNASLTFDKAGAGMPELKNMKTWTDRLGHSKLRSFTDEQGRFWLEQNRNKASKWAKLARKGHEIAWEFAGPGGAYTGRMLIDGEIYTPSEATKTFLRG